MFIVLLFGVLPQLPPRIRNFARCVPHSARSFRFLDFLPYLLICFAINENGQRALRSHCRGASRVRIPCAFFNKGDCPAFRVTASFIFIRPFSAARAKPLRACKLRQICPRPQIAISLQSLPADFRNFLRRGPCPASFLPSAPWFRRRLRTLLPRLRRARWR